MYYCEPLENQFNVKSTSFSPLLVTQLEKGLILEKIINKMDFFLEFHILSSDKLCSHTLIMRANVMNTVYGGKTSVKPIVLVTEGDIWCIQDLQRTFKVR